MQQKQKNTQREVVEKHSPLRWDSNHGTFHITGQTRNEASGVITEFDLIAKPEDLFDAHVQKLDPPAEFGDAERPRQLALPIKVEWDADLQVFYYEIWTIDSDGSPVLLAHLCADLENHVGSQQQLSRATKALKKEQ